MTGKKELYDIFEVIYPVGIIIDLTVPTNPKDLFGIGEWEQIKDCFLLAAGDSYTAGNKGGSSTHIHSTGDHTLTVDEMPAHTHGMTLNDYLDNSITGGFKWGYVASGYHKGSGAYILHEGGSQPHNHGSTGSSSNMPPYYVCYRWKRVS